VVVDLSFDDYLLRLSGRRTLIPEWPKIVVEFGHPVLYNGNCTNQQSSNRVEAISAVYPPAPGRGDR
jgi:hypothetical protein